MSETTKPQANSAIDTDSAFWCLAFGILQSTLARSKFVRLDLEWQGLEREDRDRTS